MVCPSASDQSLASAAAAIAWDADTSPLRPAVTCRSWSLCGESGVRGGGGVLQQEVTGQCRTSATLKESVSAVTEGKPHKRVPPALRVLDSHEEVAAAVNCGEDVRGLLARWDGAHREQLASAG